MWQLVNHGAKVWWEGTQVLISEHRQPAVIILTKPYKLYLANLPELLPLQLYLHYTRCHYSQILQNAEPIYRHCAEGCGYGLHPTHSDKKTKRLASRKRALIRINSQSIQLPKRQRAKDKKNGQDTKNGEMK